MLDLYDDIPVYCGGRLPHGRVHFDITRELWKLPNIGVRFGFYKRDNLSPFADLPPKIVDNETYVTYEIREPYSIIYDELKPFLLHDESSCLLVIGTAILPSFYARVFTIMSQTPRLQDSSEFVLHVSTSRGRYESGRLLYDDCASTFPILGLSNQNSFM